MSVVNLTTAVVYASLTAAMNASSAGDTLGLTPGLYVEDFPLITHSLTIEGLGGLAQLQTPLPEPANGRAILSVAGNAGADLTVINLELSGAVDPANNGAGILFETGNGTLTVSHSWIHGNQDGILTGTTGAITIENSEIDHNGVDPVNPRYGFDHNVYVGAATSLTVTGSYIHDALGGHEIKSRAAVTTITDNRIFDLASAASYSIDIPDGGLATITGNVIEQGANSPNRYSIHFGGEANPSQANSSLTVQGNTLINHRSAGGTAIFNASLDPSGQSYPATVGGNTAYNFDEFYRDAAGGIGPADTIGSNALVSGPAPTLDTTALFPVPEPHSAWLLGFALPVLWASRTAGRARWRRTA